MKLASIIINNYNYGRFLNGSIDSALNQTHSNTEVIVVDDGSTDNSREIIKSYERQIISVLKENGGQASSLNAGFSVSKGEVVIFLDSDDILLPTAVERSIPFFNNPEVVKVHWPLSLIDEFGRKINTIDTNVSVPDGDFREFVMRVGPNNVEWSAMSSNVWARKFLNNIFPIPEVLYKIGPDAYISELSHFYGIIKTTHEPQSLYRRHKNADGINISFEEKLVRELKFYDNYSSIAKKYCEKMGFHVSIETWKSNSWWYRLKLVKDEIEKLISQEEKFILVDDLKLGINAIYRNRLIHFLERNGQYWGVPRDDDEAIRELERLRYAGAKFLVFAWSSFWWLDFYSKFNLYLRATFKCVSQTNNMIVFDIKI
ncbi:MAG: glycosyltransferase family 2 protein [Thermodesulfobacteriota bacterium]